MKSNLFNILYRVCDSVENYNSIRITGKKKDVILKSFSSLVESIVFLKQKKPDVTVNFHIVYDKTSKDTKDKFLEIGKKKNISFVEHSTSNNQYGNMASFKLCYNIAKDFKGYIFFLEDDYLLDKRCCYEMFSFLNMWKDDSHICLKPHQDSYIFTRDQVVNRSHYRQREIFLGAGVYWFHDITSTCTFCIDDFILKESKDNFEKTFLLPRVDEQHLNHVYERFPLFAPILSLGIHFHSQVCFPPFFAGQEFKGVEYDVKGVLSNQ